MHEINRDLKFKPAFMLKSVSGAPLAVDLSANFYFNDKFTLGASYRLGSAVSAIAGFQASDEITIGYAYDYETTELSRYNSGSHEIFVRFELWANYRNRFRCF
jgi:type IX secretion system PorP/SprF family membrane protein